MVHLFLKKGFIEPTTESGYKPIQGPRKEGGLADYQWDYKSSLAPFTRISKKELFRAFICLLRVHRLLRKKKIGGVLKAIEDAVKQREHYIIPTADDLNLLADCVDVACAFYTKKVFCLGWASTFVLLALQKGWRCNLLIGAQALPFYAHAWAECDRQVINDDAVVQEYLSVLLRAPFAKDI